jgi:ATP/maltotriose-dependent transcriptional regulator MalT
MATWRGGQLWGLAASGRVDEARQLLVDYPLDPAAMIDSVFPLLEAAQLSFAARLIGDGDLAQRCLDALAPFGDLWCQYGSGIVGPASWMLGLCEHTLGHLDAAAGHYRRAMETARAADGAAIASAISLDLAEALLERGEANDQPEAQDLLTAARAHAEAIDAPKLVERVDQLRTG